MTDPLLAKRNEVFGNGAALFYKEPINIVRGQGVYLYDDNGNEYIDMYNNVPCVGHCHPHVVEEVSAQLAQLNTHNRYLHDAILRYGERLLATHHAAIDNIVFSCTGTEANEVALMMARACTQGQGIVCTNAAYHGNSFAVRQLSRPKDNPLVRSIPFPESYRCPSSDQRQYFLDELRKTIAGFAADDIPFAGLLICSLCANEGLPDIPDDFMADATAIVHDAGGLVVADEVQAGLGRSGNWWGYEYSKFLPDIVSMGKPLGAGMPLAATAASRNLVETFRRTTRYFNTFASSPGQAAAGNAVLDVFAEEQLLENVSNVGSFLKAELTPIVDDCDHVGDLRQKGLFVAIEWVESRDTKKPDRAGAVEIANALKNRGFLIGNAGAFGNVLKVRPPLVFGMKEASSFLTAFDDVLRHHID